MDNFCQGRNTTGVFQVGDPGAGAQTLVPVAHTTAGGMTSTTLCRSAKSLPSAQYTTFQNIAHNPLSLVFCV